jgi:site-specific recombinase XerD
LFLNRLRLPYSIPKSFALLLAFHCFRHSYATLQIAAGTDIYTVSKMLTHRNVSTTQIYAELVSEKKRESANKISLK